MITLNPRLFDRTRPLVMARFAQLLEHEMSAGDPLTIVDEPSGKGEVTDDIALRLWLSRVAVYADQANPTPIETPQQEAERVVVMEELGGGWYLIRAPWLGEGVKVQGKDAADKLRAAFVAKGDTKGVTIEPLGGGWWAVQAPWLDDPTKVQGTDQAEHTADLLIAAGPPAGWRPLTAEEKQAAAEQASLLDEARAQAEADAAAAAEKDRLEQEAAAKARQEEAERAAAEAAAAAEPPALEVEDPEPPMPIPTADVPPLPADEPPAHDPEAPSGDGEAPADD